MELDQSRYTAFREINDFVGNITAFISANLEDMRDLINTSAIEIIQLSEEIAKSSTNRRSQAEEMMVRAHLNPDPEVKANIEKSQAAVENIIKNANKINSNPTPSEHESIQRMGSSFSKNVEAISNLEEKVSEVLLNLAGNLSLEDVLKQLLENVIILHKKGREISDLFTIHLGEAPPATSINSKAKDILACAQKSCKSASETRIFQKFSSEMNKFKIENKSVATLKDIEDLHKFFVAFHSYLCALIKELHNGYQNIITKSMDAVQEINIATAKYIDHSNSLMVSTDTGFENKTITELKDQNHFLASTGLEPKNAPKELKVPQELLKNLDGIIGEKLVVMMGHLSVGDVLAQRMENLFIISDNSVKLFHHFLTDFPKKMHHQEVNRVKLEFKKFTYNLFICEEERRFFYKTFGDAQLLGIA